MRVEIDNEIRKFCMSLAFPHQGARDECSLTVNHGSKSDKLAYMFFYLSFLFFVLRVGINKEARESLRCLSSSFHYGTNGGASIDKSGK